MLATIFSILVPCILGQGGGHITAKEQHWYVFRWVLEENSPFTLDIMDCSLVDNPEIEYIRDWEPILNDVIYNWNNIPENGNGNDATSSPEGVTFQSVDCITTGRPDIDGKVRFKRANRDNVNWRAETSLYFDQNDIIYDSNGEITDILIYRAIVKVNEYYLDETVDDDKLQSVLCNALGWALGPLRNQDDPPAEPNGALGSCMSKVPQGSEYINKYPNKQDRKALDYIYPGNRRRIINEESTLNKRRLQDFPIICENGECSITRQL
jgi:hypothetical protein